LADWWEPYESAPKAAPKAAATEDHWWTPYEHAAEVVGEGALHAVPDTIGFVGDLANEGKKAVVNSFNRATGRNIDTPAQRLRFPGTGEVAQKVNQSFSQAEQEYTKAGGQERPAPRNKTEEYLNNASRMAADALVAGGPKVAGPAVVSGVSSGVSAQAAHDVFPKSEAAPIIAAILGGAAPHFMMPVVGRVTSGFGAREAPIEGASTYHQGIDIAVPAGTPVKAPLSGVVTRIGADRKAGRWVEVDHGDGLKTKYLHLSKIDVKKGDPITQGDILAQSGATGNVTGPHLHWAAFQDGKAIDPRTIKGGSVHDIPEAPDGQPGNGSVRPIDPA
jgi:murein DD-endopeptidase MepM/ murein hydrolase activator NlpD